MFFNNKEYSKEKSLERCLNHWNPSKKSSRRVIGIHGCFLRKSETKKTNNLHLIEDREAWIEQ